MRVSPNFPARSARRSAIFSYRDDRVTENMFKGYARKVIVVRDTGSRLFERAYFVMRDGENSQPIKNMTEEATRIIENAPLRTLSLGRKSGFFFFSLGLALSSVMFTLAVILLA